MILKSIWKLKPLCLSTLWLFYILFSASLSAQEAMDLEIIEKELLFQIDEYRKANSLQVLKRSESLDAVAFDQAEFVAEKGRLVHEQEKENKKTLADRILYFEALNSESGENIALIAPNSKAKTSATSEKTQLSTEELLVKAAIFSWLEDEVSATNINDPQFYEIGIGVNQTERKEIVVSVVFASMPYQLPNKVKQKFNFRGVESRDEEKCKEFDEKFSTAPELFSDAFHIEDGGLFFEYHNKKVVEKIMANSSDAISAEILCNDQFACGESNRLFPGDVTDGYLMPLLKKGSLLNLNLAEKDGEVKLRIGDVPEVFQNSNCEINGMIIKDNAKCATIPFNKIIVKNLLWLDLPLLLVQPSNDSSLQWTDTLEFVFQANDEAILKSDIEAAKAVLQAVDFKIHKAEIDLQLSPSSSGEKLTDFSEQIAQSFQLDSNLLDSIEGAKTSWEAYGKFQENTVYQIETKGMDKPSQIDYLKETAERDKELKAFLDGLNVIKLKLAGQINLEKSQDITTELRLFHFARKQQKPDLAIFLLNRMIVRDEINIEQILNERDELNQQKSELPLINNLIVAASEKGEVVFDGNPITTAFLEIYLIDKTQPQIRYNYLVSQLHDWANGRGKPGNYKDWSASIDKVRSKIDAQLYAKVKLNFNMVMADYFYDSHDPKEREDAFKEVMNWIPKAALSLDQIYSMAEYLAFQDQFTFAIKSLLPTINSENPPAKHLFYFLQLAIYDTELVPQSLYLSTLKKTQKLYPSDFCKLFGKDKMGIQLLKNYEIKALYCDQCLN